MFLAFQHMLYVHYNQLAIGKTMHIYVVYTYVFTFK